MNRTNRGIPPTIKKRIPKGDPYWCWLPDGWYDLVVDLDKELAEVAPHYELHQCKEKFGTLRYYIELPTHGDGSGDKKAHDIINKYEQLSSEICDVCGNPGKLRNIKNWMVTRCDKHNKSNKELKK